MMLKVKKKKVKCPNSHLICGLQKNTKTLSIAHLISHLCRCRYLPLVRVTQGPYTCPTPAPTPALHLSHTCHSLCPSGIFMFFNFFKSHSPLRTVPSLPRLPFPSLTLAFSPLLSHFPSLLYSLLHM